MKACFVSLIALSVLLSVPEALAQMTVAVSYTHLTLPTTPYV